MKKIYVVAFTIFVSACSTGYQQSGLLSYGFSDKQLADNVWRVTFEGNSSTSVNQAYDMATLRASDIALEHHYNYFVINDTQNTNQASVHTSPGAMRATSAIPVTGGAPVTVMTRGPSMTFTSNYPTSTLTVTMYRDRPQTENPVYDAQFVCKTLGAENGVSCGGK